MSAWSRDELDIIGGAEEIDLAPRRRDGTLRKPVTVWVVRAGDGLYVRSYKGHDGAWLRSAQVSHEGRIQAGGVEKEVTFAEETDPGVNDQIDIAYRSKYRRYADTYVPPMLTPQARATTLKLVQR